MINKSTLITFLFAILLCLVVSKQATYETNEHFEEYKNKIITKLMESSRVHGVVYDSKLLQAYKAKIRAKIVNNLTTCPAENDFLTFREIQNMDDPTNFFCDAFETKLANLPKESRTVLTPWSAYYWSIKSGGLSFRYNQVNSALSTYKASVESYNQPADHNRFSKNSTFFANMVNNVYSPSEKYDLLVGDLAYTLTNSAKAEGERMSKDENGDVAGWMGKCHGWTPASINEPRPVKSVSLTAADGVTVITFYPEDIKALATLFWAEAQYTTKFLGSRCNYKNFTDIPSDSETGLWDDYSCFTVNPATLTITIANQIGLRKKNLIFDPDSNGQIWNQPVFGYSMSYFNPITNVPGQLEESKVSMLNISENLNSTKFLNFFSKKVGAKTKYAVGVRMHIEFVFENPPQKGMNSKPDNIDTRDYKYVLELDENDNIVGGEWTKNSHPIFIWNPSETETPFGYGDDVVKTFDGTVENLNSITGVAKKVSQKNTVLGAIVKYLIAQSKE